MIHDDSIVESKISTNPGDSNTSTLPPSSWSFPRLVKGGATPLGYRARSTARVGARVGAAVVEETLGAAF